MRRQAFDVLVLGSAVVDHLFRSPPARLVPGETLDVKEVPVTLAGSGANVAVGLARLGLKVGLIATVGKDVRGDVILRELAREGVETGLMARTALAETGLSVTVSPAGHERSPLVLRAAGASDLLEVTEEVIKMLHTTRWLYLAEPTAPWAPQFATLLETLAREPTRLAWHPSASLATERRAVSSLLEHTDLLFAELETARTLVGEEGSGHAEVERALLKRGAKTVVLSVGDAEFHALAGGTHCVARRPEVTTVDPRGAADAFRAGFLGRLLQGKEDHGLALQWGLLNAVSAESTLTTQKGLLTRSVLEGRERAKPVAVEKTAAAT